MQMTMLGPGPERERLLPLFLLADESPDQVRGYLQQGDLYVAEEDGNAVGLTLVLDHADGREIKAVAVSPERQGQGIGRSMLTFVLGRLREQGVGTVVVATGASSLVPLMLYQKLGFRLARIDRDAFTPERGYPDEIWENGIRLRDMVWLDLDLDLAAAGGGAPDA